MEELNIISALMQSKINASPVSLEKMEEILEKVYVSDNVPNQLKAKLKIEIDKEDYHKAIGTLDEMINFIKSGMK